MQNHRGKFKLICLDYRDTGPKQEAHDALLYVRQQQVKHFDYIHAHQLQAPYTNHQHTYISFTANPRPKGSQKKKKKTNIGPYTVEYNAPTNHSNAFATHDRSIDPTLTSPSAASSHVCASKQASKHW
jgi:hypothetical protein